VRINGHVLVELDVVLVVGVWLLLLLVMGGGGQRYCCNPCASFRTYLKAPKGKDRCFLYEGRH
jgi:hypothetical protein